MNKIDRKLTRERRKRRRAARVRLMRMARGRAFREHPFVCWSSTAIFAFAAGVSAIQGVRYFMWGWWSSFWMTGIAFGLLLLAEIWLVVVLRLGPFSPRRKTRARFWRTTRFVLVFLSAMWLFQVVLYLFAMANTMIYAPPPGQSALSFYWELLWGRDGPSALFWVSGLPTVVAFVLVYVAYRLGPVIRRLEGKCARCGYLLRGLPEPRCPECGTSVTPEDLQEANRHRLGNDRSHG